MKKVALDTPFSNRAELDKVTPIHGLFKSQEISHRKKVGWVGKE